MIHRFSGYSKPPEGGSAPDPSPVFQCSGGLAVRLVSNIRSALLGAADQLQFLQLECVFGFPAKALRDAHCGKPQIDRLTKRGWERGLDTTRIPRGRQRSNRHWAESCGHKSRIPLEVDCAAVSAKASIFSPWKGRLIMTRRKTSRDRSACACCSWDARTISACRKRLRSVCSVCALFSFSQTNKMRSIVAPLLK